MSQIDISDEKFLFKRLGGGDLKVLTCYPNTYEIGMSSLGYQTVFKLFASNPKTHTFRYFTNFHESIPKKIELISFSVSWELDFLNVVKILKELNIPIKARERTKEHPFVLGGGPCLAANPEPWADFFDFIALGDAEDNIDQIINTVLECKQKSISNFSDSSFREELLQKFVGINGIYVPVLSSVCSRDRSRSAPANEMRPVVTRSLAFSAVIAPKSCWQDTYLLEVVRSCPELCRFCLVSYLNLPFRAPNLETNLVPKIKEALKYTTNIGLLGPSVTQHPEFMELLRFLVNYSETDQINNKKIKLQLASVRASTVTKEMTDLLNECGVRNLTIAVESGSERLRNIINKKLPEADVFNAAHCALASGFKTLKLYGMVGLPYETEEDIDLTIDLLGRLKSKNKALKIVFGCSIFTPKAQTPFQDFGIDPSSEKKIQKLKKYLTPQGIEFRPESYKWAQVQALISRGDRTINDLMIDVYNSGEKGFGIYKKLFKNTDKSYGGMEKYNHFVFGNWSKSISSGESRYPWSVVTSEKQSNMLREHGVHAQALAN